MAGARWERTRGGGMHDGVARIERPRGNDMALGQDVRGRVAQGVSHRQVWSDVGERMGSDTGFVTRRRDSRLVTRLIAVT